ISTFRTFARLLSPAKDVLPLVQRELARLKELPTELREDKSADYGLILARLEARDQSVAAVRDEEVNLVTHHGSPLHVHVDKTKVPGPYHLGIWIEGEYRPGTPQSSGHGHAATSGGGERFTRLLTLTTSIARPETKPQAPAKAKKARKK